MIMIIMTIKTSKRVFLYACFLSSVPFGCCKDYTGAGKCTVDGEDNKEDKTREEADMTPCPFLDALASLDFKLSVSQWVSDVFTASASTGLSDYFFFKSWCPTD